MSYFCDDAYKICDSNVYDMCKAGKAILLRGETINAIGMKCCLNVVTYCVIIASVIRSNTEKLLKYISY